MDNRENTDGIKDLTDGRRNGIARSESIWGCIGNALSCKVSIDADYSQACGGLSAWSQRCHGELDEIERKIREREEAIDVDELHTVSDHKDEAYESQGLSDVRRRMKELFGE